MRIDVDKKNNFTEIDFVCLFLSLLAKNGIYRIDEMELRRKLWGYYKNPKYEELFQDICKCRNPICDEEVEIQEGLKFAKNYLGMCFNPNLSSNLLIIRCFDDKAISNCEKQLSKDGVEKIHQMASEFGIRYKIEKNSKYPINIYNISPNQYYTLVYGKYHTHTYGWELLTDANELSTKYYGSKNVEHLFWEDPTQSNSSVQLKDSSHVVVGLTGADYAIMQGFSDGNIQRLKVYTAIVDPIQLQKISEIANKKYEEDNFLISEKPYVRKIELK